MLKLAYLRSRTTNHHSPGKVGHEHTVAATRNLSGCMVQCLDTFNKDYTIITRQDPAMAFYLTIKVGKSSTSSSVIHTDIPLNPDRTFWRQLHSLRESAT